MIAKQFTNISDAYIYMCCQGLRPISENEIKTMISRAVMELAEDMSSKLLFKVGVILDNNSCVEAEFYVYYEEGRRAMTFRYLQNYYKDGYSEIRSTEDVDYKAAWDIRDRMYEAIYKTGDINGIFIENSLYNTLISVNKV